MRDVTYFCTRAGGELVVLVALVVCLVLLTALRHVPSC